MPVLRHASPHGFANATPQPLAAFLSRAGSLSSQHGSRAHPAPVCQHQQAERLSLPAAICHPWMTGALGCKSTIYHGRNGLEQAPCC